MKAIVFHGIGDIRLDDVPEPELKEPTDAIVRITASAICGTDLHMIRGTMPGMKAGTILGHEAVGIVEEVGKGARNLKPGDRVVVPSTIACGACVYCRAGYHAQCDVANPNGPLAGTAFFGGPEKTGPFNGLQAEFARIPFAHAGLVKLPQEVNDDEAVLLSDIFPTGYFGARMAEIKNGDTVAVFGCGPVGMFAIISAQLLGASRVVAVDCVPSRLDQARAYNAEIVNFDQEDPVEAIRDLTQGIGVDRAIDAVGVDAVAPHSGPAAKTAKSSKKEFQQEQRQIAPQTNPQGEHWVPGNAPSQALRWAVDALCKAGTLSIVGVYPSQDRSFPIGMAMGKNLTINMGNCHHRKYIPLLLRLMREGAVVPSDLITQEKPIVSALEAYQQFDLRQSGWMKVVLEPETAPAS